MQQQVKSSSMGDRLQPQLTNAEIAELLARQAEQTRPPAQRALRRASRRAFLWEASQLFCSRRSLTQLSGVGPYIARLMYDWIAAPPRIPNPPPVRAGFITLPQRSRRTCATKRVAQRGKRRLADAYSLE
jgi:hypothetical protein